MTATLPERPRLSSLGEQVASDALHPGACLLDEVAGFLARFVAFPSDAALTAVTLWIAHTHAIDSAESTPRIAFLSPEPASGKTRALEVSELLVPNPMHAVNATPAALFRAVKDLASRPTILFDEIDTVFGPKAKDNEEIRGLLNAGHRRGAVAYRCVGEGTRQKVEPFPAYAAVALAGLGDLPDTIMTRSVVIRMRRRAPGEHVEPFRHRVHAEEGHQLREALAGWATTVAGELQQAWPEMPPGISDRPADVWEPLLAIADAAGGRWPIRARKACIELVKAAQSTDSGSLGLRLLGDLRMVFGTADRMSTETVLQGLVALDESPWSDLKGKALDSRGLAHRLRPYGVTSTKVKIADASVRGYRREDLHDAWQRYLPPSAGEAEPVEPPEPPSSEDPDQVPDKDQVPEPLWEAEPQDPPLTCDVPEVPQVPLPEQKETVNGVEDPVEASDSHGPPPALRAVMDLLNRELGVTPVDSNTWQRIATGYDT